MESNYGMWVKVSNRLPEQTKRPCLYIVKWYDDQMHVRTMTANQLDDVARRGVLEYFWLDEFGTAAAEREEDAIEFGKWLKHLDNGTTHYNPYTKEETASIGFSPADCFADDAMSVSELYAKFTQQKEK